LVQARGQSNGDGFNYGFRIGFDCPIVECMTGGQGDGLALGAGLTGGRDGDESK